MTVAELIEFLKTQPANADVAFCQYSDYSELEPEMIQLKWLQMARGDGYVGPTRPDQPKQMWLVFPGN